MCGIAGFLSRRTGRQDSRRVLERMIFPLRHRGPDGVGFFLAPAVGLAHARLSIIDLEGGWQPIHNEDRTLWIVFNGEIFNYRELRPGLEARGHSFYTRSDTEVILHLFEEKGEECLAELNGQFAIAIYDRNRDALFLARDRMGIRPLYYTERSGTFYFASEVKSIFAASPDIPREISPGVLSEIFSFWMPVGNESVFSGIRQLPPAHFAWVHRGRLDCREYWDIPQVLDGAGFSTEPEDKLAEGFREILEDAARIRLRSDVPVGAYLSGGIDSSAIAALVKNHVGDALRTFSVSFSDEVYDERDAQQRMVEFLGTSHDRVNCAYRDIAEVFPDVLWHTETPILRTAPAPLFLLSRLVADHDYKVVLTGEGADEILGGYDLFKETKIRAFIARNPESAFRPYLLKRLYPYLALSPTRSADYARRFFDTEASLEDPFYSHRPRWRTTAALQNFFSDDFLAEAGRREDALSSGTFARRLALLDVFSRAQYLETKTLLPNYLLASQGDRMAMAHSVEGRFPFLDHRVVEFAWRIPPHLKMRVLEEKYILKQCMRGLLPDEILARKKQPYMAPDILSFFGDRPPEYLDAYLSEEALAASGIFKKAAVGRLLVKCRKRARQGFRENMAFVGILSTQILYDKFVRNFSSGTGPLPQDAKVVESLCVAGGKTKSIWDGG